MKLKGKTALITGTKRVGQVVAKRLAQSGANIAAHYNTSSEAAESLVEELRSNGANAISVKADISKSSEVNNMVEKVVEEFGSLDVLVTMASYFKPVHYENISEEDWDLQMSIDLKGTWLCVKAASKVMLKQGGGKIITFGDWAAKRPYKNFLPYFVAKGGIMTMTKVLAVELAPTIQVNCIMPGPVLLPDGYSEEKAKKIADSTLVKRIGSPDDIAETVNFLIEGSDFITGVLIPVEGGRLLA